MCLAVVAAPFPKCVSSVGLPCFFGPLGLISLPRYTDIALEPRERCRTCLPLLLVHLASVPVLQSLLTARLGGDPDWNQLSMDARAVQKP